MKRVILLLLILLVIPGVSALSVTLDSPSTGNTTSQTTILFTCSATDTFTITSIALYTDTSGSWAQTSTHSGAETSYTFTVTAIPTGTYKWNCLVSNSNAESSFAVSNSTFTVSSLAFSGTIANQSFTEDSTSTAINLGDYFTGATYYTFSGNSSILISINSNALTFSSTNNWSGSENIIITAHDTTSTASSNTFAVSVTNVNDSPYFKTNFSNKTTNINTPFSYDMSTYFGDPDTNTTLNYSLSSTTHFTTTKSSNTFTLTPTTDWEGSTEIYIIATDGSLTANSNAFTITVSSSSTSPTIDSYTPETDPSTQTEETQTFTISASDPNGDTLTYVWSVNAITQDSTTNTMSYTPETDGTYEVKVTISDGTNEVSHTWTMIVGDLELTDSTSSIVTTLNNLPVCGNNIVEEGETCSTCLLDVRCEEGSICKEGVCQPQKTLTKSILILTIASLGIIIISILIYYFTTLKKTNKNQTSAFQYKPTNNQMAPPSDYSDFYKGKK